MASEREAAKTSAAATVPGREWVDYNRTHNDLREFLERADRLGEVKKISGASAELEMAGISEMFGIEKSDNPPALLFDAVPGYKKGFRVVWGAGNSRQRCALTYGFPEPKHTMDLIQAYRDRMHAGFTHIPPVTVKDGPILENVDRDDAVDLLKFPAPRVHEIDGGRYLGTHDLVIMRDPETGWVNVGTYRVQVYDRNTVGLWISPGKHGRLIREKYFAKGLPCPVAISVGTDPLLFITAGNEIDYGVDEFSYAGGHRGRPFEVIASELHGLPIPARDEIVLEGEIMPDDVRTEGPFGEFTGYYASGEQRQPAVRIRRVYHRNDPIVTTARPGRPPHDFIYAKSVSKAATIWDEMEKAGLPGIHGVWSHEAGGARMFNIVSIQQMYPGHARQAGHLAFSCHAGNYLGRWVIVVDDDIDPTNIFDVIWAMSTRCDPAIDIDIVGKAWSGPLDPMLPKGQVENTRAIVDACRPWSRKDSFPPIAAASEEVMKNTYAKWRHLLTE
jgi:UbiD family decarboxylase